MGYETYAAKRCSKCGLTKPLDAFAKHKACRDGYQQICKDCKNAYLRAYYARNPEQRQKRRERKWRWREDPQNRAYENAQQYDRNKAARENTALISRRHLLKKLYGMTLEQYDELAESQGGCAICGGQPTDRRKYFHVDHDHDSGEVRGLLCSNCNTALGLMKEDIDVLKKAIEYLSSSIGTN